MWRIQNLYRIYPVCVTMMEQDGTRETAGNLSYHQRRGSGGGRVPSYYDNEWKPIATKRPGFLRANISFVNRQREIFPQCHH